MTTILNASNGATSGLIATGDNSGVLQLQTNNGTPALTLNATQALGVGSSPSYGTSGQVLTSGGTSASPTWTTPSSGAMSLISTQTASNSASLSWTGLTLDKYMLVYEYAYPSVASASFLGVQFGVGSTPTYNTSSYQSFTNIQYNGGTGNVSYFVNSGSLIYISADSGNSSSYAQNGSVLMQSLTYNSTVSPPSLTGISGGTSYTQSANCVTTSWGRDRNYNSPVTAIKVLFSSGNITSGSFSLYGISS